ncbi:hypothetical protein FRX31_019546, partial [Thalictrum thalictroides]
MGDITIAAVTLGVVAAISRELVKGYMNLHFTNKALNTCKKAIEDIKKDGNVTSASVTVNANKQTVSVNQTFKPSELKLLTK